MQKISRRSALSPLPVSAAALAVPTMMKGDTLPPPPTGGMGDTAKSAAYLPGSVQTKARNGKASSGDYAAARTALTLLGIHWAETGVHSYVNAHLKNSVANNPHGTATEAHVQYLLQGMTAFGAQVTVQEVRAALAVDASHRSEWIAFFSAPNALERIEAKALGHMAIAAQGGNVPAVHVDA